MWLEAREGKRVDKRRAARIRTPFHLAVEGIDPTPVLRHGNISAAGLYVEVPKPMGDAGSVEWLHLSSLDGTHKIHVMAHVVRTIAFNDISKGSGYGIALEFMPENDSAEAELQTFVAYVLARKLSSAAIRQVRPSAPPDKTVEKKATPPSPERTQGPPVHTIEVDASWPYEDGETIEVLLHAPKSGNWVRCETKVERVHPVTSREIPVFRTRLAVHSTSEGNGGGLPLTEEDLEDWMSRFLLPPDRPSEGARGHLSGVLSRIKLPTILSLLEMDRMTGELALTASTEEIVVFVQEGRVVDVTGRTSHDARGFLRRVMAWAEGTFRFDAKSVSREDRLGTSTTGLILDLVRQMDEEEHSNELA